MAAVCAPSQPPPPPRRPVINLNIGLLGHVDSGKTSLAKALSSVSSTAAFDKSPQSQQRGITLDLGFSAFYVDMTEDSQYRQLLQCSGACDGGEKCAPPIGVLQCTLVDCPGHASLIRTVLGGAQIIDVMVLVVDAVKGIQAQTAECLVVGEVLNKPLVVALNKVDSIQGSSAVERRASLEKTKRRLAKTFELTRWPDVRIVEVAADPRIEVADVLLPPPDDGAARTQCSAGGSSGTPYNIGQLIESILLTSGVLHGVGGGEARTAARPTAPSPFLMLVDHCFAVRGQGTVFTGTVLSGTVAVGDDVFIPERKVKKKVKGIQAFRKPVASASRGDRIGISVAQFDAETMERGLLCGIHGAAVTENATTVIAEVHKVRFHKLPCNRNTKYHITIGHSTVMATFRLFSRRRTATPAAELPVTDPGADDFRLDMESSYEELLPDTATAQYVAVDPAISRRVRGAPLQEAPTEVQYFAVVMLEKPVTLSVGAMLVATRLDLEQENVCRLAFSGTIRCVLPETVAEARALVDRGSQMAAASLPQLGSIGSLLQAPAAAAAPPTSAFWRCLPIVQSKCRVLKVDRVISSTTCIASGVVVGASESESQSATAEPKSRMSREAVAMHAGRYLGFRVTFQPLLSAHSGEPTASAVPGVVDSLFGQSGKVKLVFAAPVFHAPSSEKLPRSGKGKAASKLPVSEAPAEPTQEAVGDDSTATCFLTRGSIEMRIKKYPYAEVYRLTQ